MNLLKHHLLEKRELTKKIGFLQAENQQLKQQGVPAGKKLKWFKRECKRLNRLLNS